MKQKIKYLIHFLETISYSIQLILESSFKKKLIKDNSK
jgi:hypothetical protein